MRLIKNIIISFFILAGTILSLNFYLQRNQRNVYNNLLTDLNQLYDLSIEKREPMDNNCNQVVGYMFESRQDDNYRLVEWCSNGYFTFKNVRLNKNIISINSLFPTTTFKVNGSTTNLTDDNHIMLKHKFFGKNYEVIITVDGEVLGD